MEYRPIRKDLTETTQKCHFCLKNLNSLKAYVLQNIETREYFFAGPICTKKHIRPFDTIIGLPDLTKFTCALAKIQNNNNNNNRIRNSTQILKENHKKQAYEYIELRENKLYREFSTSYPILAQLYKKSQEVELNETEIKHILNIENKAPEKFKLINLQKCYNYSFWIDIAIKKVNDKGKNFLVGIKKSLMYKHKLTSAQIAGVNNWLKYIDGIPQLR